MKKTPPPPVGRSGGGGGVTHDLHLAFQVRHTLITVTGSERTYDQSRPIKGSARVFLKPLGTEQLSILKLLNRCV